MRFAIAHKVATYLMVGCAYFALVAGGGLSPLISLGGLVALVASWWWEPPLIKFERWSLLWTIGSVLALLYSVLTAVLSADFLGVGAQFLVWLIVAKAFNRRAARDWQHMYLLAFLMLVAGSVLNPDLTYGLCFLGFVIASTWALTLFHLRREMEDNFLLKHADDHSERVEVRRILESRRIVDRRFFVGTGLV
ncbi:MAG TPA: transglutaminaseTgpA domain-containing protein, partial [Kofleriaceae bacterium]|nr:transglutaminaseTgpA domain-containing protein [Kofleriaceae bacterium]